MVWIAAIGAGWLGALVLLVAMTTAAARSDRPTADHLRRRPRLLWLPPHADADERFQ
jgi:hypothetical protein